LIRQRPDLDYLVLGRGRAHRAERQRAGEQQRYDKLTVLELHVSSFLLLTSDTEIGVELFHVRLQLGIGETVDDLAVLDDVVAVRNGGRETEILLDQEDGEALRLQPRNGVADLLD